MSRRDTQTRHRHDRESNPQNVLLIGVGSIFVASTLVLSLLGTKVAVNNIDRNTQSAIIYAQQNRSTGSSDDTKKVVSDDETESSKTKDNTETTAETDWSSEQIQWMTEHHITYDAQGRPVDENGNVVTDPTVQNTVKETAVATEPSTQASPEPKTNWADGKDYLTKAENGDYVYTVIAGDRLSNICQRTGFTLEEVCTYNQISNPDVIYVGQQIHFPAGGPGGEASIDKTAGLG